METAVKKTVALLIAAVALILLVIAACDKEKIVNTTETIHETEYIELPPDTIMVVDTVQLSDSVLIEVTDTLVMHDTVIQVQQIYDTITVLDTVIEVQTVYDTTYATDTVIQIEQSPNENLAFTALQYYTDPIVITDANSQIGVTDGWVFYLSAYQSDRTSRSAEIYDIYGYIDFWSPDWMDFIAYEYYWRLTYTGGDPADPLSWDISEPPAGAGAHTPGITRKGEARSTIHR
jgi:hypothetical protein